MTLHDYPYRPRLLPSGLALIVCGAAALAMARAAATTTEPFSLGGLIDLSPGPARILFGIVAAMMAATMACGLLLLGIALSRGHRVVLTETCIRAPRRSYAKGSISVPLSEIESLVVQAVQRERLLHIHHRGGELSIARTHLPSNEAFERLCAELTGRIE